MFQFTSPIPILKLCVLTLAVLLYQLSRASVPVYLTQHDGLTQNSILCMHQDSKGFLWVGTPHGLNRYDGLEFKHFRAGFSDNAISANYIFTVFEDSKNRLWIGTSTGGLNLFNYETETFEYFLPNLNLGNTNNPNGIWCIAEDQEGMLWMGTDGNGLLKFDPRSKAFTLFQHDPEDPHSLGHNHIRKVFFDANGQLWLATKGGGISSFDIKSQKFTNYFPNNGPNAIEDGYVRSIHPISDQLFWIATNSGIEEFDLATRSFKKRGKIDGYDSLRVYSIFEDSNTTIWIATAKGVFRYNRVRDTFTAQLHPSYPKWKIEGPTRTIFEDERGILWFGTNHDGLVRYDPNHIKIEVFSNDPLNPNSLNNNTVRAFYEDENGRLWVGTVGGGVSYLDPKTYKFKSISPETTQTGEIMTLESGPENELLVGTWGQGITKLHISPDGEVISHERVEYGGTSGSTESNQSIKDIFFDSRGVMWVGSHEGVMVYDPQTSKSIRLIADPANPNSISSNESQTNAILEDSFGNIWIGTWNGLNLIKADDRSSILTNPRIYPIYSDAQEINTLTKNQITAICEDDQQRIWIGTFDGGISRLDLKMMDLDSKAGIPFKFERLGTNSGLPSEVIFAIVKDNSGNLWISTNNGISRWDSANDVFTTIDKSDGLVADQFYWGSGYMGKDGMLYMGTNIGFNKIDTTSFQLDELPPLIRITKIESFRENVRTVHPTSLSEVHLSYKDQILTVQFAALDYSSPNKNRYAYLLEGRDSNWIHVKNQKEISFFNLNSGNYTLRIKASNADGVWNEEGISITINISTPYWETLWFRITILCLTVILVVTYIRLRIRKYRMTNRKLSVLNQSLEKEIESRKKVEKSLVKAKYQAETASRLKSEFLAQISHEIRTPLNGILSFSDLLKDEIKEHLDQELITLFDSIKEGGNRLRRSIDQILMMSQFHADAYKPNFDSVNLACVVESVVTQLTPDAAQKSISLTFDNQISDILIRGDLYSLEQLLTNLIENAIKYTDSGSVLIGSKTRNEEKEVVLKIEDTGIGMSDDYVRELFSPFSQEYTGDNRQYEGNGLGLALVKNYCDINNAKIEVVSYKGEGTIVTLTFDQIIS